VYTFLPRLYRRSCAGRIIEIFCNLDFLCKTGLICAGAKIYKFSYPHNLQSVRLTMSASPPRRGIPPISAVAKTAAEKQSKRGPGYTNVEDMIVARAFISASENPVCGNHQKGKVFKAHMLEI
jgi:hypothetical protein